MKPVKKRLKTGGRQKGTPNRVTLDLRATLKMFLEDYSGENLKADFEAVKPATRLQIMERLMRFVLPTLQSVDMKPDLSNMNDEQINLLFKRVVS